MSKLLEQIKSRRSVRKYKADAVPQALLDQIIEAGLYAASGRGGQSAIIVQVTDKGLRDRLSRLNAEIQGQPPAGRGSDPFYGAPAVLIVLAKKDSPFRVQDGSLALGNMMLAAHALGLGSCWINRAKEEFERDLGREILADLGIVGEYEGVGHCVVGYVDGECPEAAPRRENRVYKIP